MTETDQSAPWWRGAAIYQIYPRSFLDTTGNGIGDLRGITQQLGYVRDLGVDAVWLSPFFRSPMKDFGYDVSDYRDVDPLFGTMADFDSLIAEADRLDLPIIIDQVYSHTSDEHAWFRESSMDRTNPKADWYVWADAKPDGSPPNNWQSIFGGSSWAWSSARQQYFLHNFLTSQPDLNLHSEEVQAEILDTARFWLDKGVKGFRLDALHCSMHDQRLLDNPPRGHACGAIIRPYDLQWHQNDHSQPEMPKFLERFRQLTDEYGAVFSVAEVGADDALTVMKSYTSQGRLQSAYSFEFLWAPELSADLVRSRIGAWPEDGEAHWPSWAFSNHDAQRVASRWDVPVSYEQRAQLFALLLMSLRGNVFVYQGEELGLRQADVPFEKLQDPEAIANWPHSLGRDGARTPMPWRSDAAFAAFTTTEPWLPVDPEHHRNAVERQDEDETSVLHFFRKLIGYRRGSETLRLGRLKLTEQNSEAVVSIERRHGEGALLAVFNLSDDDVSYALKEGGKTVFSAGGVTETEEGLALAPWSGVLMDIGS